MDGWVGGGGHAEIMAGFCIEEIVWLRVGEWGGGWPCNVSVAVP